MNVKQYPIATSTHDARFLWYGLLHFSFGAQTLTRSWKYPYNPVINRPLPSYMLIFDQFSPKLGHDMVVFFLRRILCGYDLLSVVLSFRPVSLITAVTAS